MDTSADLYFFFETELHPCFVQPPPDTTIWRYMNFGKLIDLLSKRTLFFCRADRFDDPFEGIMPRRSVDALFEDVDPLYGDSFESMATPMKDVYRKMRQQHLVSCWHINPVESAAMWKLYLSASEGVAIRSTFGRFAQALPKKADCPPGQRATPIHLGRVRYIDYDKEVIPMGNAWWPFMTKRLSFEHERELRAVFVAFVLEKRGDETRINLDRAMFEVGVGVPVDVPGLVDRIFLAPTTPPWFAEAVRAAVKALGYNLEVLRSSLDDIPV